MQTPDTFETKLRPQTLKEFIGQQPLKDNLALAIEAGRSRGEALDHVLLYGPPGVGKTTLAAIIANEMGVDYQQTSGPTLDNKHTLSSILTNLRMREVLFLDEIHRMPAVVEEILYQALEDYRLDIIVGQGNSARTHTLDVSPFTLVAATTKPGALSAPLRSRFGIVLRVDFYSPAELKIIVQRSAAIMAVQIEDQAALEIASRSRGTPRIANRLLRRCRDYAQIHGGNHICLAASKAALKLLEVDEYGFDNMDRRLLRAIIDKYRGGPVGLNTLAAALSEDAEAIEEMYEPFLIQAGFLDRTSRGRMATPLAYKHFGLPIPQSA
jgi:Holliday junction DNA helicase RuvB